MGAAQFDLSSEYSGSSGNTTAGPSAAGTARTGSVSESVAQGEFYEESNRQDYVYHVAEKYGVPGFETEVLWRRFVQLGGDRRGVLDASKLHTLQTRDTNLQLVFRTLPLHTPTTSAYANRAMARSVTMETGTGLYSLPDEFYVFEDLVEGLYTWNLHAIQLQTGSIFKILTGPHKTVLDKASIGGLVRLSADTTLSQSAIEERVDILLSAADHKQQGFIDLEDFTQFIHSIPEIEALFKQLEISLAKDRTGKGQSRSEVAVTPLPLPPSATSVQTPLQTPSQTSKTPSAVAQPRQSEIDGPRPSQVTRASTQTLRTKP
ncbi:uncharacterized protein LOC135819961 [Sycon ciliatum]|uniref:uncharacterized protein LOC135819961 n=1 Tax=Sycon ciliatum TaxID=27933 RepID=UPI0031F60142